MAKTSSLKPQRRGVHKGPAKKQAAKPRQAPAKAPKKAARKALPKVAGKPGKAKPARRVADEEPLPGKAASRKAAHRDAARPRRSPQSRLEAAAEHDHQDPRLAGVPGAGPESSKVQTFNYGQFKNKAVARFDKPVNWFRRAPRPKQ